MGPRGWSSGHQNDVYTKAHGNKPEYMNRVRGVRKNILPMRGNIHSYYTLSQTRSQNLGSAAMFEMIQSAIQAKREHHKQQMDEMLAQ